MMTSRVVPSPALSMESLTRVSFGPRTRETTSCSVSPSSGLAFDRADDISSLKACLLGRRARVRANDDDVPLADGDRSADPLELAVPAFQAAAEVLRVIVGREGVAELFDHRPDGGFRQGVGVDLPHVPCPELPVDLPYLCEVFRDRRGELLLRPRVPEPDAGRQREHGGQQYGEAIQEWTQEHRGLLFERVGGMLQL